jgi:penicillin-binding protein 1A
MRAGEIVEGGSTITQQLAKMLFFSDEQSYIRKAKEAITAIKLTNKYSKDEIITMYLNEIYMGGGAFGMAEAADTYFSKTLDELTLGECAMLAGIITAPSAYCPLTDEGYAYACQRKDKVLDAMLDQGYITQEEADAAKAETVVINPSSENYFSSGVCLAGYEGYMNRVFEEAVESIAYYYHTKLNYSESKAYEMAESALFSQNLVIRATLNNSMQQNALSAIDGTVSLSGANGDAAFISIDSLTGNVLAYYGSSTYVDTVQNPRQPGSTIKPLYMSYLIESGLADRNTVVNDERITV